MLTRAHEERLIALVGGHDIHEGWNILAHAPAMLQRDIWALTASRIATPEGHRRCLDGMLWCLADGVRPEQWRWLGEQARLGGAGVVSDQAVPTLLYDPATLWPELEAFTAGRAATTQRWLTLLLRAGANLCRIAPIGTELPPDTPVVLLRSDLYDPAHRDAVRRHRHHALVAWGPEGGWQITLSGTTGGGDTTSHDATEPGSESADNATWIVELPMAEPTPSAVDAVARWINQWSVIDDATVAALTRHRAPQWDEVTVVNRVHAYTRITLPEHRSTDLTIVTRDSCVVRSDGDATTVQLPPLGTATVRVRRSATS